MFLKADTNGPVSRTKYLTPDPSKLTPDKLSVSVKRKAWHFNPVTWMHISKKEATNFQFNDRNYSILIWLWLCVEYINQFRCIFQVLEPKSTEICWNLAQLIGSILVDIGVRNWEFHPELSAEISHYCHYGYFYVFPIS